MAKSFVQELGERLASVESRLSSLSSGNRLDHASLDGTTLYLKGDGQLGRIGRQPDGSNGVHVVKVQPPPQLTAAILTVGEQAGTCLTEWDGRTFDGRRMPLIHGHTEVWAELVGEDWSPTVAPGEPAKRVGTIRDRTGGEVVVALPQAGTWAVWLRAMGADRETAGPWSPVATVEIKPLVDTEAIQEELDQAQQRIDEADQRLTEGQGELDGKLDLLDERVGPGVDGTSSLTQALSTGLDDVYREAQQYAESQADNAVNQAAANAQSEYDRLQEIAERALSRAGDNVLEDPSFESEHWPEQWDGTGGRVVRSTTTSRTGSSGLVVEGGNAVDLPLPDTNAESDQSFRFQVWYRTWASDLADLSGTYLRILDSDTDVVLAESEELTQGSSWRRAQVVYQIPDGVQSIKAVFHVVHPSGLLIMDDMSLQEVGAAAEALRLAEVARQEAEAAHIAAGDAQDAAALAYDAANTKSSIHWALSAPSGTGNPGDVWWKYETTSGGRRRVIGEWHWESGVWRETEVGEDVLAQVDIGTGTYGDLHGDRMTVGTVAAEKLRVGPVNMITDPEFETLDNGDPYSWHSEISGAWHIGSHGNYPRPLLRFNLSMIDGEGGRSVWWGGSSGDASMPCIPGEVYSFRFRAHRFNGSLDSDDYRAQYRWHDKDQNALAWSRVDWGDASSGEWVHLESTAPEGAYYFSVRLYKVYAVGGARGATDISLQRMTTSDLLVDGAVKSRSVDTEEFFSNSAVIGKIWNDITYSRLVQSQGIITEDMIATGAITTPKLTVTEEMVGEVAKLIRIEADSLASNDIEAMRIVSSLIEATTYLIHNSNGDVSVRLDGVDNYFGGRLHAGMDESRGIAMDYGEVQVTNGWTDEEESPEVIETHTTPFLEFKTDHSHLRPPQIYVDSESAGLTISPGRLPGTGSGSGQLRVWGRIHAHRFIGRRLEIPTTSALQPGGMYGDGPRTRLHGRTPSSYAPQDMFSVGRVGGYTPVSTETRASVGWGSPPELGMRRPVVSGEQTSNSYDNYRQVYVTTSGVSASGFDMVITGSTTGMSMWVNYNASWQ